MSCAEWEERIAEGARGVEPHLAECARCREFARALAESMALLKAAHEEPIAPAHYAAVRARVLGELERRRVPVWRRAWVYGLAAAALVLAAGVWLRPGVQPPPVAVVRPPAAPATEPVVQREKRVPVHKRVARVAPTEPLLIKLETDNPDVVLYWIADKRGDY